MNETILVVDDDREIVRLLRGYLEQANFSVLPAHDGKSALALLRHERPALMLLDLMLPDLDGWEITRRVRADERLADTPIIMLTARVDDVDKILGLELGADDYVTKPFNPREVVARVRAMLRRNQRTIQAGPTHAPLKVGELLLDPERHTVTLAQESVDLTPTEFNILHILMQHPGYVFTRSELVEKALGYGYDGMDRTLDSHIKNLRRKIEPESREPRYILTVYGVGYRMAEQGS